jgi:hypothetical protein
MFKYNKSKTETTLEEEKEAGSHRDHRTNKEEHMDHPCVISSPSPLVGVVYNP